MAALIQYVGGVPSIKFSLEALSTYIGRAPASDICLTDKFVSKQHALIEVRDNNLADDGLEFIIRDLDSTNRTFVNEEPVKRMRLKHQDTIRIGEEQFIFEQDDSETGLAELKAFPGQEQRIDELTLEMKNAPKPGKLFSRRLKLF